MRTRFYPLRIFLCLLSLALLSSIFIATVNNSSAAPRHGQGAQSLPINPAADQLPTKTDYNRDDEPKNKLIGSPAWQEWLALPDYIKAKVDPRLIGELSGEILPVHLGGTAENHLVPMADQQALEQTRFIVYMEDQLNLRHEIDKRVYASSAQQRSAAVEILSQQAQSSQAALQGTLNERISSNDVSGYQSFFIVNAVAVEGNLDTIVALAKRLDVSRIQASYPLVPLWDTEASSKEESAEAPAPQDGADETQTLDPRNWNIDLVDAERVWRELHIRGDGAVVAGFDTGVEFTHPALNENYRGKIGDNEYDHNYSWFEPDSNLYPDGNLGASLSDKPADCSYSTHGTHTMGTMVGRNQSSSFGGTDIGMAPNARWIAVPGICNGTMPGSINDDIGGLKAFQWLLCPTDLSGDLATADCSKAPDVVNNSWGSANPVNDILHPAIEALRAAGIAPVFASGNPNAGEGSIGTPANSPDAITVGATDRSDNIAYFSGRGPSFYENELKPELTAPGVSVLSSTYTDFYDTKSGTSMAAPHVAGLVALMVSADLADGVRDFSVDDLERFMTYTAVDLGPAGHDDDYGFGRIDAYAAVSWVKSAGDLRGVIRDASTDEPIAHAQVVGTNREQSFDVATNASGQYSITAPAGVFDIEVTAWGYESKQFSGQTVFPESLSLADFQLDPVPQAAVSGVLNTGQPWPGAANGPSSGSPIANAQIMASGHPDITATTSATGAFTITLPNGTHQLEIRADNHRSITTTTTISVTQADGGTPDTTTLDLTLDAAPRLLLVDADASGGWFMGWPVYPVFEYALTKAGYPYELWRIEHLDFTDMEVDDDGYTKHGIPSLETLQQYDAVIWMHSGCSNTSCFVGGTPEGMGAGELLIDYLENGGHLILSGQNVSAWARTNSALMAYLGSEHVSSSNGSEGERLEGTDFLQEISVEITNATLYGYNNGLLYLSPDAVRPSPENAVAVPILRYTDGNSAALATSPCTAAYRSVFFAAGYENLGPRGGDLVPDAVKVLDQSIQWLSQEKQPYDLSVVADQLKQSEEPGATIRYAVDIVNSGLQPLTIQLALSGAAWNSQIYSGTFASGVSPTDEESAPVLWQENDSLILVPCSSQSVTVEVEVPPAADNGITDVATLEIKTDAPELASHLRLNNSAVSASDSTSIAPNLIEQVTLTSVAFVGWDNQSSLPTNRYRMAVESLPDDVNIYAIGGWDNYDYDSSALNERYNACTGRWTEMARMPSDRSAVASTVWDGKIYVSGGVAWSYISYDFDARNNLYIYDPVLNSWTTGQSLPQPLYGHAMVAHKGNLYVFGGRDNDGEYDKAYVHDLDEGSNWREISSIPGGERAYSTAAVLNDKIYLVGGWPAIDRVEVYDPATNTWSEAAPLTYGRQSPGMTVSPDGYLYVAGGGNGWNEISQAERLLPGADAWEVISSLRGGSRVGSGLAYAAGQIHAIGGNNAARTNESLLINSAFCLSERQLTTPVAQPGGTLSYRVDVEADLAELQNITIADSIPLSTSFAGFEANPIGATFNAESRQIEWSGELPANADSLVYTYTVALDDIPWFSGTEISSTIRFQADLVSSATITPTTQVFTRTNRSRIVIADFEPSMLTGSSETVIEGEIFTYTLDLRSSNAAGSLVTVSNTLPEGMSLLEESISWPVDSPQFNTAPNAFVLSGTIEQDDNALINSGENYIWNDSLGSTSEGDRMIVADYEWIDIEESGRKVLSGDDRYQCDHEIDFPFDFYGESQSQFCISTNGFISFDLSGYSALTNECPMPNVFSNRGVIAALWDDLVTESIYIQTIGTAPSRSLVIQYVNARRYASSSQDTSTFQIILQESGNIKIQFLELPENLGGTSTTGLSNSTNTVGVTYACNTLASLTEKSAVLFTPPGGGIGNATSSLSFAVQLDDDLPINTSIENSVQISDTVNTYTRTLETVLNPVGLETVAEVLESQYVNVGEQFNYQFSIENSGQLTAGNVSFTLPIPKELQYVSDSINCSAGECSVTNDKQVRWKGSLAGREQVVIGFGVELTAQLKDGEAVVAIGYIDDGFDNSSQTRATIFARSSNLQESLVEITSPYIELDQTSLMNIVIRNTGSVQTEARAIIDLPTGLNIVEASLVCGTGQCSHSDGTVTWQGTSPPRSAIPVRFYVQAPESGEYGEILAYTLTLTDLNRQELSEFTGQLITAQKVFYPFNMAPASPRHIYLPVFQ